MSQDGVDIKQMKATEMAFPVTAAALTSGAIDAAYIIEPYLSRVEFITASASLDKLVDPSFAKAAVAKYGRSQ